MVIYNNNITSGLIENDEHLSLIIDQRFRRKSSVEVL